MSVASPKGITFILNMASAYQIDNPFGTYFLTFQVVDWVDIFSRKVYKDIIVDSFSYCRKEKGLKIWAYVIMTNHVHCILSSTNENLSSAIRDFKRFTATQIIDTISVIPESRRNWMLKRFEFSARKNARNSLHQFWTHDNHAEIIITAPFFAQKLNYIHMNPVKAGWVEKAEDWLYSSARNYAGMEGLMEVDVSDF
jgi:REP element-mobilizing transposase RayT